MTDLELITLCKNKDEKACTILYNKYYESIHNKIYNIIHDYETTQELTQEVLIKVFNKLHYYDNTYCLSTWINRIAVNHTIDYLRKQSHNPVILDNTENSIILSNYDDLTISSIEDIIINKENIKLLYTVIEKLSPMYKKVIELYYFKGNNYNTICRMLNINISQLKSYLFKARKKLLFLYLKENENE